MEIKHILITDKNLLLEYFGNDADKLEDVQNNKIQNIEIFLQGNSATFQIVSNKELINNFRHAANIEFEDDLESVLNFLHKNHLI